ncbi:MAG: hypothetical protein CM1200mP24_05340 [Gammaproteobacteria bacterium]|nr:MAG: hypothetical protein CM1200mP24_05340 [Gammaproteobacteria bacterium]
MELVYSSTGAGIGPITKSRGRDTASGQTIGDCTRVQGMKRYYGLLMHRDGVLQMSVNTRHDGISRVPYPMELSQTVQLTFSVEGTKLKGSIDAQNLIEADDRMFQRGLLHGCRRGKNRYASGRNTTDQQ